MPITSEYLNSLANLLHEVGENLQPAHPLTLDRLKALEVSLRYERDSYPLVENPLVGTQPPRGNDPLVETQPPHPLVDNRWGPGRPDVEAQQISKQLVDDYLREARAMHPIAVEHRQVIHFSEETKAYLDDLFSRNFAR